MIDRFVNNVINANHNTKLNGFVGNNDHWGKYWFDIQDMITHFKDAKNNGKDVFTLTINSGTIEINCGEIQTKEDAISQEIKQHLDHIERLKEELKK
jgi:hypothetical protein